MMEAAQTGKWSVAAHLVAAALVTCVVAGCGNNGQTDLSTQPGPDTRPAISGVVLAPNGVYARAGSAWDWANALLLTPRAAALQNVAPAQGTLRVALSQVSPVDAADGSIDSPLLINQNDTDGEGAYRIVDPIAAHVDTCRLMVSVGSGNGITRAFVTAKTNTNIDAVSEAVVRVILDRVIRAPAVNLCDFSVDAIVGISNAVDRAATLAFGDTVAAINDDAFTRACTAAASAEVKQAVDNATGRPASTGCGTSFP
jgi:hypothetical protein